MTTISSGHTTQDQLESILTAAAGAAPAWAATSPADRAAALVTVADALDEHASSLVTTAERETGLSNGRLTGELKRTTVQLRLFADVIRDGSYLDARIDDADPDFVLGTRPDLRRVLVPAGVTLNFAASNFPFAFSVAGGDSAAALAAGSPVIVKGHSGHPDLSVETAQVVVDAFAAAGAPDGVFALIQGQKAGTAALNDDRVDIGTFTGSIKVGRMLADIAAARPRPIPFFGELGSVNPAVVTTAAFEQRGQDIAQGFLGSVAGSAGQLCTKPGFLWIPSKGDVAGFEEEISKAAADVPKHRLLNPSIGQSYIGGTDIFLSDPDVRVVVEGSAELDEDGQVWATPTIVSVPASKLAKDDGKFLDEVFGPFSVLVEYDNEADVPAVIETFFEGNLTGTIHIGDNEESSDLSALISVFSRKVGRVLFNGWPTGVAVSYAQQHGGPYPATTNDSSTSVGTAAISRFLRGVAFQNAPQSVLPPALQDTNPWGIPRHHGPAGESQSWGLRKN
ncbi:aldehyde dehydrogenase [Corynebacterium sp. CNJ-954]|uniref:aldehyde dehydrogenase (NADP(+)) n=1 Tax=Corynebacterium sp. CNJ-954 TaxID=1904962 RepID=UPI000964E36A|nr:aldehyde dehydrogenase (NADP(+)) [Corynebacterium sp. CNJ-954]OLT55282.1 aldehyde dehydrogenase [Corynebacterium sp. CNJ-954]